MTYANYATRATAEAMSDAREFSDITSTVYSKLRAALVLDLRESRLSRQEVAARLGIGVAMLEAYIAESKPHRFPAELVPAWVRLLESTRILHEICGAVGLSLADQDDREFAELGRVRLRDEKLTRKLWEKA